MLSQQQPAYSHTCISCCVAFQTSEMQRTHFISDWHRYNLKRKLKNLPPVGIAEFNTRLDEIKSKEQLETQNKSLEYTCTSCHKSYTNHKNYLNHVESKKHKANKDSALVTRERTQQAVAATQSESEQIEAKFEAAVHLSVTDCLFCNVPSFSTVELALDHMETKHSFFIPDQEFLVDVRGLLKYLGEKISVGNACIWCYSSYNNGHTEANTKGLFTSINDVRNHMLDKGHCKIQYENGADLEISDYYDFSSTWDAEDNVDAMITSDLVTNELILPSGKVLGHRDLTQFYKQKPAAAANEKKKSALVMDVHTLPSATLKQLHKQQVRSTKTVDRAEQLHHMKLGMKANGLQHHFREQVLY